jgi:hypothetical protein
LRDSHLKDGLQIGQDFPPILASALSDLLPNISRCAQSVGEALKEMPVEAAYMFAKAGEGIIKSIA